VAKKQTARVEVVRHGATMHREYIERFAEFLKHLPHPYARVYLRVDALSYQQRSLSSLSASLEELDRDSIGRRTFRVKFYYKLYRDGTTEQMYHMAVRAFLKYYQNHPFGPHVVMQDLYDKRQPQLGIVWAMPPAPPKKRVRIPEGTHTPLQKKVITAKAMVTKWTRRESAAKRKRVEYEKKLRRLESREAAVQQRQELAKCE